MKNIMSLIILILFALSCNDSPKVINNMDAKDTLSFNCLIYPSGVPSDTYTIELNKTGTMMVKFGAKLSDSNDFTKLVDFKSKILTKAEIDLLAHLQKEVLEIEEMDRGTLKKGGWEIIFETSGKRYHFYYGDMKDSSLDKIIELIKEISPLKIDIHGWS